MQVHFTIHAHTEWGEQLFLVPQAENTSAIPMRCVSPGIWQTQVERLNNCTKYHYCKKRNNEVVASEPQGIHTLPSVVGEKIFSVTDEWTENGIPAFVQQSSLPQVFAPHPAVAVDIPAKGRWIVFRATNLFLRPTERIVIVGETTVLGGWDISLSPEMQCVAPGEWQIHIPADQLNGSVAYKYCVVNNHSGEQAWQQGDNRTLEVGVDIRLQFVNIDIHPIILSAFRSAGVVVPIFSLRTAKNWGVGDFPSIKQMVDWASLVGLRIIQTLPVNDTTNHHTWQDSYPYNAISVNALHPLYLGAEDVPLRDEAAMSAFRQQGERLNALPDVDYEAAMKLKQAYIDALFAEQADEVEASPEYAAFRVRNEQWLPAYAFFSVLRNLFGTADFSQWSVGATYHPTQVENFLRSNETYWQEVRKCYFVQYLLDKQLREASLYARSKGVILKGDIPIGINPHSADAWTHAPLFNMNTQTGAPPDDFAVLGQNWGFPTYNWERMAEDGYKWWRQRFAKMADYFDAYRIDHILGFFRIWQIPQTAVHALLGHFNPALPLSAEELQSFGITTDTYEAAIASLSLENAKKHFGEHWDEAVRYLHITDQRCYLRSEVSTQSLIVSYFANKLPAEQTLCRLLLHFCNEVLFVCDKVQPHLLHPRISAYQTLRFGELDAEQQQRYMQMYEHFYFVRHNHFWQQQALKKLPPLLSATQMLACGEDLGMIPACVPQTMQLLGILSLEIERMPKTAHIEFEPLGSLPTMSVCATSTHDMPPLRLWWQESAAATQRYYNQVLWQQGDAPQEVSPQLATQVLTNHLNSPSLLAIFPLQDWLSPDACWRQRPAEEEQINVPAIPNFYWKYRMHIAVEQLVENKLIGENIRHLLHLSQRI